jgi:diguanylate cyclase (GGDEF)-like protein
MHSGSIVKLSTRRARRAVLAALVGVSITALCFIAERSIFQKEFSAASVRLLRAQLAADKILLADERLTMSANMAAATGEKAWGKRYDDNIPLINTAIADAMILAPPEAAARFDAETRAANERLAQLAKEVFARVRADDVSGARAILNGEEYLAHKKILSQGTAQFVVTVIADVTTVLSSVKRRAFTVIFGLLIVFLAGGFVAWRLFNTSLRKSEAAFLEIEGRIQHLAMNDILTGLPNRSFFRQALRTAIERAAGNGSKLAVLVIDLDRFKPINDKHGHLVGDLVLQTVAARLANVIREEDICARYGGDEFVVITPYSTDNDVPRSISGRIVEALSSPMIVDGLALQIGASVGFAVYPTHATEEEDLIRKADMALYRVKLDGRGSTRAYDHGLEIELDARSQLEDDLRQGIRSGEIVPYFQPLIELSTGRACGFEVLSRWQHASKGLLPPDRFITLAEETGQITDLTIVVLRQACRTVATLPREFTLAINISPQQLQDEGLPAKILDVLIETGFSPHFLQVELTERALVTDIMRARGVISSLKRHGIKVALDDFGTGYSSLSALSELPFDMLKIDRSLVTTLHDRPESLKIVTAIAGLSKSLNLTLVAEGVETELDATLLAELGCDVLQGYFYSKPVPATELPALLSKFSPAASERKIIKLRS